MHDLVRGTGISPNFPYFRICGSSGWASVMALPWKAGNYPKNRQLVRFRIVIRFRIVRMTFCIRDNHEMRRARAHIVRCHHGSGGIDKAVSLLLRLKLGSK